MIACCKLFKVLLDWMNNQGVNKYVFLKVKNLLGLSVLAFSTATVAGNNIVKIGTDATYPLMNTKMQMGRLLVLKLILAMLFVRKCKSSAYGRMLALIV